jgi:hypothetical protein
VRPSADRLNRSLEPDVLGDHHAVVDDSHQGGSDRPRPHVAGELGCSQVGERHRTGVGYTEIVDRFGVMKVIERRRTGGLQ